MRGPENPARWNSPKQLYDGYINSFKVQRPQNSNSLSQPRITRIGCGKVLSESDDFQIKRVQFDSTKKEAQKIPLDQTRKINMLKTDLSDLKLKVTQIISTDKQFISVHNGLTPTNQSFYYVKQTPRHSDGFETPTRQFFPQSQNSTIKKDSTDSRIQTTVHKSVQLQSRPEQTENHQLREDLRQSAMRERKLVEEREELVRRLQEKTRELEVWRQHQQQQQQQQQGHSSERMRAMQTTGREQVDKSMEIVIEGLRRQNSDMQVFYKQKLEEADRDRKAIEAMMANRNQDFNNAKAEIFNLQKALKNQESIEKMLEKMQQSNRKLEKDLADSVGKMKGEQQKAVNLEERLQKMQQTKKLLDTERNKLQQQNKKLKDVGKVATDQISKLKESMDSALKEKNREIDALIAQRDKLKQTINTNQQQQLQKSHSNNLIAPPLPPKQQKQEEGARGKSQTSRSSIFVMGSNSSSQYSLLEQARKQQAERLTSKIDDLKKQKKAFEIEVKTLLETKQAIELSIKNQPKLKQVEQLRGELNLKEQTIAKMCDDIRNLQEISEDHKKLNERVKTSENLLRQANECIMRKELGVLNKKYN